MKHHAEKLHAIQTSLMAVSYRLLATDADPLAIMRDLYAAAAGIDRIATQVGIDAIHAPPPRTAGIRDAQRATDGPPSGLAPGDQVFFAEGDPTPGKFTRPVAEVFPNHSPPSGLERFIADDARVPHQDDPALGPAVRLGQGDYERAWPEGDGECS